MARIYLEERGKRKRSDSDGVCLVKRNGGLQTTKGVVLFFAVNINIQKDMQSIPHSTCKSITHGTGNLVGLRDETM